MKRTSAKVALAAAAMLTAHAAKPANAESVTSPTALFATVCWKKTAREGVCRELQLTPGAAGPLFPSVQACTDGMEPAKKRWLAEAGPVYGLTDGEVTFLRCGPPEPAKGGDREAKARALAHPVIA